MINRYLEILGLKPGVSSDDIKDAYRRLAKLYHPDLNKSQEAKQKFIEIHEAYKYLNESGSTPEPEPMEYNARPQKSEYDLWRESVRQQVRKKAKEREAYRLKTLQKVYRIFNVVMPVIILFNLVIIADYALPRTVIKERITGFYEVYGEGSQRGHTHDVIEFETFSVDIPTNELYKIRDFNEAQVSFTRLFHIFTKAEFGNGISTIKVTPEYDIYKVLKVMAPLVLLGCIAYFISSQKANNRLSFMLFVLFMVAIELVIFFGSGE